MKKSEKLAILLAPVASIFVATPFLITSCKDKTQQLLDEEVSKIKIDILDKANKTAKSIKITDIHFHGYDTSKYQLVDIALKPDGTKLEVKYKLELKSNPAKKSKEISKTIEGFKEDVTPPITDKIDKEVEKIAVDVENKDQKTATSIRENDLKFSNFDDSLYKIIDIQIEILSDKKSIKVSYKLQSKTNSSIISKAIEKEISGFKENVLDDFAKTLKTEYTGDVNKTDANEVELTKIKFKKEDGTNLDAEYEIKDLTFVNSSSTDNEIYNGEREISFKLVKGTEESSPMTTKVSVHKSHKEIHKLRDELKSKWELINSYEAQEILKNLTDDAILHIDYKTGAIYDKEYNKPDRKMIFKAKTWTQYQFDTIVGDGTDYIAQRNKLTLKKDSVNNKYSFTFKVGKINFNKIETARVDYKLTEVNPMEFTLPSLNALNQKADEIKNSLEYTNKADTYLNNAIESGLTYTAALPADYIFKITSFEKDFVANKLTVKYKIGYKDEQNISLFSNEITVEISGFKEDSLAKEFENMTVEYTTDKTVIMPSQVGVNDIKIYKSGTDYNPTGIEVTKTIFKANDALGKLDIKIELKKDDRTVSKIFTIEGFKTKAFSLENILNRLKVAVSDDIDKSTREASSIKDSDITVVDPDGELELYPKITKEITLNPKDGEGILEVTVKLTYNGNSKEKIFTINGFKKQLTDEAIRELLRAEGNNLFDVLEQTEIDKLNQIKSKSIYLKQDTFKYGPSGKKANQGPLNFKFKKEEFNKNPKFKEVLFKTIIHHKFTGKKGNRKALEILKNEDGKYYLEFMLLSTQNADGVTKHPTVYKWIMQ